MDDVFKKFPLERDFLEGKKWKDFDSMVEQLPRDVEPCPRSIGLSVSSFADRFCIDQSILIDDLDHAIFLVENEKWRIEDVLGGKFLNIENSGKDPYNEDSYRNKGREFAIQSLDKGWMCSEEPIRYFYYPKSFIPEVIPKNDFTDSEEWAKFMDMANEIHKDLQLHVQEIWAELFFRSQKFRQDISALRILVLDCILFNGDREARVLDHTLERIRETFDRRVYRTLFPVYVSPEEHERRNRQHQVDRQELMDRQRSIGSFGGRGNSHGGRMVLDSTLSPVERDLIIMWSKAKVGRMVLDSTMNPGRRDLVRRDPFH